VANPVEGTILTVMREASEVATQQVARGASLKQMIASVAAQAKDTVRRTPELLPKLKEAGVVDAGGKGLFYIFLGMKNGLTRKSRPEAVKEATPQEKPNAEAGSYGFDVQFLIEGKDMPVKAIRQKITSMGESVLVVGDNRLIRVHAHSPNPQAILDYSGGFSTIQDIILENMDEQVKRLEEKRVKKSQRTSRASPRTKSK